MLVVEPKALYCHPGNSGCGVWILTVSKPLIYGNRIADCGDSGVALVSNSDLHHDNQQLSSQFSQSEQEVSRVMSCLNTACVNLVPRVLSYPSLRSEREPGNEVVHVYG